MLSTWFPDPKSVGTEKRAEAPGVRHCCSGWDGWRSKSRLRTRMQHISFL